jgi:transcription-repair coupling factor (superfamily II helicase)
MVAFAAPLPRAEQRVRVRLLPDWETLPYDTFRRTTTSFPNAWQRCTRPPGRMRRAAVPASTALYRLSPPAFLAAYTFFIKKGEKLDSRRPAQAR